MGLAPIRRLYPTTTAHVFYVGSARIDSGKPPEASDEGLSWTTQAILIAAGGWRWQNGATCFAKAEPEQGLLPADATSRLGYHWGPILSNPAMACVWPELRTNLGPSVRKFIEDSTPETDQAPCQVELQAFRDETIVGRKKNE